MANSVESSIDPLESFNEWRLPLSPEALIRVRARIGEIHKRLVTESRRLEWEDFVEARQQAGDDVYDVITTALLDCNALEESMLTWQVPKGAWGLGPSGPLPIAAIVECVAASGGWRFMGDHRGHPSDYRCWNPQMSILYWRERLASKPSILAEAVVAPPEQEDSPSSAVTALIRPKRGRPTKIPDQRKTEALAAQGGKARAQILYDTHYPTPQQVKNVPSILKHYSQKCKPNQG